MARGERKARELAEQGVDVACAGCGKTARVLVRRLVGIVGYTCAPRRCASNPCFEILAEPSGRPFDAVDLASGSIWGWHIRQDPVRHRGRTNAFCGRRGVAN